MLNQPVLQMPPEWPGERDPFHPDRPAVCDHFTDSVHRRPALPHLHRLQALPLSGLPPAAAATGTWAQLLHRLPHHPVHGLLHRVGCWLCSVGPAAGSARVCVRVVYVDRFYVLLCPSLVGNSGHHTWVKRNSYKSITTHSYQCMQYFWLCKQWYGCQR